MAKVLLDTNIILDYLSGSRPCHADAVDVLEGMFETSDLEPTVSISSLKDAYCILCRKFKREDIVRDRLHGFLSIVGVEDLTMEIAERAFSSDEPDFEDGLIRATAESVGARAIITRDAAAFKGSPIPSMDARAFCWEMD